MGRYEGGGGYHEAFAGIIGQKVKDRKNKKRKLCVRVYDSAVCNKAEIRVCFGPKGSVLQYYREMNR